MHGPTGTHSSAPSKPHTIKAAHNNPQLGLAADKQNGNRPMSQSALSANLMHVGSFAGNAHTPPAAPSPYHSCSTLKQVGTPASTAACMQAAVKGPESLPTCRYCLMETDVPRKQPVRSCMAFG